MGSGYRIFDRAATVFFFFLLVYLLTLTSNFTGPHDSMAYLQMLRTKQHLWHPHHLLYHQLSYYWLHLIRNFFPGVQEYFLVESFSSLFGAGTLTVVFLFFRNRYHLPVLTSWLGTAVVGFSYGVWFYSVNVEVYAPSLFFTALCLYQLSKREWDAKAVWLTAIFHSLAILFHQMNILMAPIVIYKIIEQRKNIFVFKSLFWYGITGLVLVGGIYILAGRFGEGHTNLESWIAWVRGYTITNEYWRPLSWKTPLFAGTGFSHTILGGHFVFKLGLEKWITSLLHAHSLQDEFFLVRGMSVGFGRIMFMLSLVLALLTLFLFIKFLARFQWIVRNYYYITVPLLLYFGVYSFYFLFWMPEILEFWIGQCIVFWLLLIGNYQPVNKRLNILVGSILLLIISINYAGSIRPMRNLKNDIGYVRIEKIKELSAPNDLALVQNPWLLKEFIEYYTSARVIQTPKDSVQRDSVRHVVQNELATGHKVFIFIDREESTETSNPVFLNELIEQYKSRAAQIQQKPAEVWLIK